MVVYVNTSGRSPQPSVRVRGLGLSVAAAVKAESIDESTDEPVAELERGARLLASLARALEASARICGRA